jgi:hypothetical protein
MLSNPGITFAGYTISTFQLLLAGGLLLGTAALLLVFARGKRIALQRSVVTDEFAILLSRIADAVERQAQELAARRIMEEKQRTNVTLPPAAGEEKHPISYSMFGR